MISQSRTLKPFWARSLHTHSLPVTLILSALFVFAFPSGALAPHTTLMAAAKALPPRDSPASELVERLAVAGEVHVGDVREEELLSNDNPGNTGIRSDYFSYQGQAGEILVIDMESSEFDPQLILVTPEGFLDWFAGRDTAWAAVDDDSGVRTDAHLVARLPESREYLIVAFSSEPGMVDFGDDFGKYLLRIQRGEDEDLNWVSVGEVPGDWLGRIFGESRVIGLQVDTVRITGGPDIYQGWMRHVYSVPVTILGDPYDSELMLEEVDCRNLGTRTIKHSAFLEGERVWDRDMGPVQEEFQAADSGSVAWAFSDLVCRIGRSLKLGPVSFQGVRSPTLWVPTDAAGCWGSSWARRSRRTAGRSFSVNSWNEASAVSS